MLFFVVLNMLIGNVSWGLFFIIYITIKWEQVGLESICLFLSFCKSLGQKRREQRERGDWQTQTPPRKALSAWELREFRVAVL